jgi:hypothetical protein
MWAATGHRAGALSAFEGLRRRLGDELGVTPGAEATAAHDAVLRPTPTARPAQLPADLTVFAGRDAELAELDGRAELDGLGGPGAATGPVAVTGMPGVGKSALAVHWAHRIAPRFPDGQLYLDLYGFDRDRRPLTAGEALASLLGALGVSRSALPDTVDARAALYRTRLAGRRMVILLDNARDGDQVRSLLPGHHGCLAIVTSRVQPIGLAARHGARVVRVSPLSPLGSRRMLERRLGVTRLAVDPAATADIVASCGGLALALAIVAARAQHNPALPLRVLAAELCGAGRWDALSAPGLSTDVRTSFALSLNTLSQPAVKAFAWLCHGRPGRPGRPAVAELTAAGLLTEFRPGRYRTHELLRLYARQHLAHTLPTVPRLASSTSDITTTSEALPL